MVVGPNGSFFLILILVAGILHSATAFSHYEMYSTTLNQFIATFFFLIIVNTRNYDEAFLPLSLKVSTLYFSFEPHFPSRRTLSQVFFRADAFKAANKKDTVEMILEEPEGQLTLVRCSADPLS